MDTEGTLLAIAMLEHAHNHCAPGGIGQSLVLAAMYHLRTGLREYLTRGK